MNQEEHSGSKSKGIEAHIHTKLKYASCGASVEQKLCKMPEFSVKS